MATLKLYNPILSEATKECYWFCDEAGTSFKDVDEFINGIPAGDDIRYFEPVAAKPFVVAPQRDVADIFNSRACASERPEQIGVLL